jgi:hypothetical protein
MVDLRNFSVLHRNMRCGAMCAVSHLSSSSPGGVDIFPAPVLVMVLAVGARRGLIGALPEAGQLSSPVTIVRACCLGPAIGSRRLLRAAYCCLLNGLLRRACEYVIRSCCARGGMRCGAGRNAGSGDGRNVQQGAAN